MNHRRLQYLLQRANYDQEKTQFLVDGFKHGFDLGYEGPTHRRDTARNLPFTVGNQVELWKKVMKEVKAKRYSGPFDVIPYEFYVQSPIGLVPKSGGQTRLIFDLSYDFKESGYKSINHYTLKEKCTVHYNDLDYALQTCFKLDLCKTIYYSKTDIQSAFRLVPLRANCYQWLIMKAKDPRTGKVKFFLDKNLPFGGSISCSHFQKFSEGLRHIIEHHVNMQMVVTNYLDDFLFVDNSQEGCNYLVREFLIICEYLGVPISMEKTEWSNETITFLGILLDGKKQENHYSRRKRLKAVNWLNYLAAKKKATVKELQSLSGLLNFLNRAIFPGRAFTRRMYAKFSGKMKTLKQYHHISLDREFKSDCKIWLAFLQMNTIDTVSRPFVDMHKVVFAEDVGFTSDASASRIRGFGTVFDRSYCYARWESGFIKEFNPNIEFLELYALCVGVFIWIDRLQDSRIWVHCDNDAVCRMINKTSSGCKYCMVLIRKLTLKCLQHNLRIFAVYIRSKDNILSDRLSRLRLSEFHRLTRGKGYDRYATCPPAELWPLRSVWIENCSFL